MLGESPVKEMFERKITLKGGWVDDKVIVEGELKDTYHWMKARIHFTFPELQISHIETELLKFPHEECQLYRENIERLKGAKVNRYFYSSVIERVGGPMGCAHLNNLIYEMGMAAVQVRFAKFNELKPPEIEKMEKPEKIKLYLELMPSMLNSCSAWSEKSPMVIKAKNICEKKG